MINGTDGAVFHPLISRNELLYIFAADLCRYACSNIVSSPHPALVFPSKNPNKLKGKTKTGS